MNCTIENCTEKSVSRGLCHKHYQNFHRTGHPLGILRFLCQWPDCKRKAKKEGFCLYHQTIKRPPLTKRGWHLLREKNHNWKGGVSKYPNHYEFKKNRLKVLKLFNYKCAECGSNTKYVHHKDLTKTNHSIDNLIPLCITCHKKYDKPYNSKFRKIYGMTLDELSQKLQVHMSTVRRWHYNDKLSSIIQLYQP